jgi:N6-L-threonylcarbamoyladenine synthase
MKILAIESSCDETAAAVIEGAGDFAERGTIDEKQADLQILSNVVVSQVDIFAAYGGVIPEVAARSHLEVILPVVHKALDDAELTKDDIDVIAVTHTPGLLGSLLIGTLTARMLAILWGKPLYAVHHLKSHIYANWLHSETIVANTLFVQHGCASPHLKIRTRQSPSSQATMLHGKVLAVEVPEFPLIALVVSGGHTQIIYMRTHNQFEIIGTTRDDAVGECFDKVAKILGLPYPGGPSIAKCANGETFASSSETMALSSSKDSGPRQPKNSLQTTQKSPTCPVGNARAYRLPHPQVEGLDFSFSGLKTAVLRAVQADCSLPITTPSYELKEHLTNQQRADFAAAFQETACNILIEKLKMALEAYPEARSVVIAGGVSANAVLRKKALEELSGTSKGKLGNFGAQKELQGKVFFPELKFAGDNAAMVGAAAYFEIISGVEPTDPYALNIAPRTAITTE